MKLSDVMSAAGLAGYAVAALVLFLLAFVAITLRTLVPGAAARHAAAARLPLMDDEGPAERARE